MGVTSSPEKNWNQKKKRKKKGKENNPFHETVNREFFLPSTRLFHGTEFHDGSNFNVGVNVINAYQLPPPPPPPPLFIRCIDRAQPSGAIRIRGSINIMSINQRHPATWKRSFVSPGATGEKNTLLKQDPDNDLGEGMLIKLHAPCSTSLSPYKQRSAVNETEKLFPLYYLSK